jgi:hypothetical protein
VGPWWSPFFTFTLDFFCFTLGRRAWEYFAYLRN